MLKQDLRAPAAPMRPSRQIAFATALSLCAWIPFSPGSPAAAQDADALFEEQVICNWYRKPTSKWLCRLSDVGVDGTATGIPGKRAVFGIDMGRWQPLLNSIGRDKIKIEVGFRFDPARRLTDKNTQQVLLSVISQTLDPNRPENWHVFLYVDAKEVDRVRPQASGMPKLISLRELSALVKRAEKVSIAKFKGAVAYRTGPESLRYIFGFVPKAGTDGRLVLVPWQPPPPIQPDKPVSQVQASDPASKQALTDLPTRNPPPDCGFKLSIPPNAQIEVTVDDNNRAYFRSGRNAYFACQSNSRLLEPTQETKADAFYLYSTLRNKNLQLLHNDKERPKELNLLNDSDRYTITPGTTGPRFVVKVRGGEAELAEAAGTAPDVCQAYANTYRSIWRGYKPSLVVSEQTWVAMEQAAIGGARTAVSGQISKQHNDRSRRLNFDLFCFYKNRHWEAIETQRKAESARRLAFENLTNTTSEVDKALDQARLGLAKATAAWSSLQAHVIAAAGNVSQLIDLSSQNDTTSRLIDGNKMSQAKFGVYFAKVRANTDAEDYDYETTSKLLFNALQEIATTTQGQPQNEAENEPPGDPREGLVSLAGSRNPRFFVRSNLIGVSLLRILPSENQLKKSHDSVLKGRDVDAHPIANIGEVEAIPEFQEIFQNHPDRKEGILHDIRALFQEGEDFRIATKNDWAKHEGLKTLQRDKTDDRKGNIEQERDGNIAKLRESAAEIVKLYRKISQSAHQIDKLITGDHSKGGEGRTAMTLREGVRNFVDAVDKSHSGRILEFSSYGSYGNPNNDAIKFEGLAASLLKPIKLRTAFVRKALSSPVTQGTSRPDKTGGSQLTTRFSEARFYVDRQRIAFGQPAVFGFVEVNYTVHGFGISREAHNITRKKCESLDRDVTDGLGYIRRQVSALNGVNGGRPNGSNEYVGWQDQVRRLAQKEADLKAGIAVGSEDGRGKSYADLLQTTLAAIFPIELEAAAGSEAGSQGKDAFSRLTPGCNSLLELPPPMEKSPKRRLDPGRVASVLPPSMPQVEQSHLTEELAWSFSLVPNNDVSRENVRRLLEAHKGPKGLLKQIAGDWRLPTRRQLDRLRKNAPLDLIEILRRIQGDRVFTSGRTQSYNTFPCAEWHVRQKKFKNCDARLTQRTALVLVRSMK